MSTSTVKRNIVANFISNGWTALTGIIVIPLYVRLLGVEAWGMIGVFASLQTICVVLDLGLSTTLSREMARLSIQGGKAQEMQNLVRTLELIYWAIGALIAVCVIALAPLIANHWVQANQLSPATIQNAITLMALVLFLQWPFSLYFGGLMGLQRQLMLAGINIGVATLRSTGAVIVLWYVSPTLHAFFIWLLAITFLQTSLLALFFRRSLPRAESRPKFQTKLLRDTWRFTAGISGITVMSVTLAQMDKVVLTRLLSLEMFGYYALAGTVAASIYFVTLPVYSALYPRFTQLASVHDEASLKDLYHRGCQLMSALILPVTLVIALFSREILFLWTGDAATVAHTYMILSVLVIGTGLNGLMHLPYALQLAYGWTGLAFFFNLAAVLVMAPSMLFMASLYGGLGAAVVWLIVNAGFVVVVSQLMHRRLLKGEQWRWYVTDIGFPFAACLTAAYLCRLFVPMDGPRVSQFLGLVSTFVVVSAATGVTIPVVRRSFITHFTSGRRRPL